MLPHRPTRIHFDSIQKATSYVVVRRSCVFAKVIYAELEGFDITKCVNYISFDKYFNVILEKQQPRFSQTCTIQLVKLCLKFYFDLK